MASLDANSFRASRDQRQCVHRWTKHVLGEDYIREAAVRYPKSKEYVGLSLPSWSRIVLSLAKQGKEKSEEPTVRSGRRRPRCRILHHRAAWTYTARTGPQVPADAGARFLLGRKVCPPLPATRAVRVLIHRRFDLYRNYQSTVHSSTPENITARGFKNFLCNSPLETRTEPATGKRLGSWHQCYRLDGRLVAMAVLDLLPECVSGVYFIYHSDFARCNLGKVSACM